MKCYYSVPYPNWLWRSRRRQWSGKIVLDKQFYSPIVQRKVYYECRELFCTHECQLHTGILFFSKSTIYVASIKDGKAFWSHHIMFFAKQDVIMSKLDRRRKGVFGPAMGKQCIIFIDDLNLPQRDSVGSIPAIELLRQVSILQLACASFMVFRVMQRQA